VIGDHGGIIEFESHPRLTTFRVLMPLDSLRSGRPASAPG
jgi:two-component system nitrogen regulation sensor histidine kinase GlnL